MYISFWTFNYCLLIYVRQIITNVHQSGTFYICNKILMVKYFRPFEVLNFVVNLLNLVNTETLLSRLLFWIIFSHEAKFYFNLSFSNCLFNHFIHLLYSINVFNLYKNTSKNEIISIIVIFWHNEVLKIFKKV